MRKAANPARSSSFNVNGTLARASQRGSCRCGAKRGPGDQPRVDSGGGPVGGTIMGCCGAMYCGCGIMYCGCGTATGAGCIITGCGATMIGADSIGNLQRMPNMRS